MNSLTIAAIATPAGTGGIGIIKISGPGALSIAGTIYRKSGTSGQKFEGPESNTFPFKSHQLYHGLIVDPENERVLDEVLVAFMKGPRSYTREDVLEIHSHSGPAVLSSILNLVLKNGARLAEPGEFTKRAFLNGRIDLTQAEAVIDIINAKTETSLEIATTQVKGTLKQIVEAARETLLTLLAEAEAMIDFPDDVGDDFDIEYAQKTIHDKVLYPLREIVSQYESAHVIRDGLKLGVVGRPNVGKSSLMNCLIQKDRVIVTSVPGTTRDLIEETLNIRGIPVVITDTAGLHETSDLVELIGIKKTYEFIDGSDLILFMIDASRPLSEDDYDIFKKIEKKNPILVINKTDLVEDGFRLEFPDSLNKIPSVSISALYNRGIETLKDLIAKVSIGESHFNARNAIIPNLRHKLALEQSIKAADSALKGLIEGISFEFLAIDIQEAIDSLGEIIGITAREDVLDQIFSRFCIGK